MDKRKRISGFSMIEVLVTVIIIAVGLLGLAALQSRAQQAELESYQRVQALILLQDMVSRINANRGTAGCYAITGTTGSPYAGTKDADHMGTPNCTSYGTSATQAVANKDLADWDSALEGLESTGGTLIGARGCITYDVTNDAYAVAVAWQGVSETAAPANNCGTGKYGDESRRRVVAATVRIGDLK